jgi:hypothetical protein
LVLTPAVTASAAAAWLRDSWAEDPEMKNLDEPDVPPPDDGTPMGLNLDPGEQPVLEPTPGPGAEVPKLLLLLGAGWLTWFVFSFSAHSGRTLNAIRWPVPRLPTFHRRASAAQPIYRPEWDDFTDPWQDAPWRR